MKLLVHSSIVPPFGQVTRLFLESGEELTGVRSVAAGGPSLGAAEAEIVLTGVAFERVKDVPRPPTTNHVADASTLVADLLDQINSLSEKLGDAAPDQRELLSKVNAWLEQREKVQALKQMPEEIAAMPADWSVTVQVDAETVLSIGHDWLSGAADFDEDVILGAAKHLLSFIGYGLPDGGFVPPADQPLAPAAPEGFVFSTTRRGFAIVEFTDHYGEKCSLQKSSIASEDAIWLGIDDPQVKRLVPGQGWRKVEVPEGSLITSRMHLTQDQVASLLPLLQVFAITGEVTSPRAFALGENKDAARYRWLRQQHEGRTELELDADGVPMLTEPTAVAFTVFRPGKVGECHLEPVGCMPGELDETIDTAMAQGERG